MLKDNSIVNLISDADFNENVDYRQAWKFFLRQVKTFLEELKLPVKRIKIGDRVEVWTCPRKSDGTRPTEQVDIEEICLEFSSPYDQVFESSLIFPKAVNFQAFSAHEHLAGNLTLTIKGRYVNPPPRGFAVGYFNALEIVRVVN